MATNASVQRRQLHYDSLDDLLRDAQQCAESEAGTGGLNTDSLNTGGLNTVGQWSLGQILSHLAASIEASVNGFEFSAPWPLRFLLTLLMKQRFLTKPIPSGYKIPKAMQKKMQPSPSTTTQAGLDRLGQAIQSFDQASTFALHPFLGQLSRDEWTQFHLRHAELHMSFVVPGAAP